MTRGARGARVGAERAPVTQSYIQLRQGRGDNDGVGLSIRMQLMSPLAVLDWWGTNAPYAAVASRSGRQCRGMCPEVDHERRPSDRPRRAERPGTHLGDPRRTTRCHALAAVPSVPRFGPFFHPSLSVPGVTCIPGVAGVPGVTCVPGAARRARRDPACQAWRGVPAATCAPDAACVPGVARRTNRGPAHQALPGVPRAPGEI
jgi:hypothetical protein